MSTRGLYGVRYQERDYLAYNHCDSYPNGLGNELIEELKTVSLGWIKKKVNKLQLVNKSMNPTPEQIAELSKFTNLGVGEQSHADWYCLLRETQGSLIKTLEAGYMMDDAEFIKDSLFCEFAYIINLDNNTLEFYRGFQEKPHKKGRYSHLRKIRVNNEGNTYENKYYSCALKKVFPLNKLSKIKW